MWRSFFLPLRVMLMWPLSVTSTKRDCAVLLFSPAACHVDVQRLGVMSNVPPQRHFDFALLIATLCSVGLIYTTVQYSSPVA